MTKILALETSCDDTCVSVLNVKCQMSNVKCEFKILSNIVSSQVKLHAKYGGVYPSLAKREHQRNLPIILKKALKQASFKISNFQFLISKQIPNSKFQIPKLDLIAVTIGPGLEPCLWTGINFAKDLAEKLNLPIVPVNHIEAHILANFIGSNSKFKIQNSKLQLKIKNYFPAICLVVSGGHTQLILMKDFGKYKILGETRDDAAGECFDKTARILGLGYPGGPAIAKEAAKYKIQDTPKESLRLSTGQAKYKIQLPRPMIYQKNYDFSFSGLKTAVLYHHKKQTLKIKKSKKYIRTMAFEIQQAIIDVLIYKTLKAVKNFKAKSIILGGGVAANEELRKQFKSSIKASRVNVKFFVPAKNLCTDNGAMVSITGYFHWLEEKTKDWRNIKANANLRIS